MVSRCPYTQFIWIHSYIWKHLNNTMDFAMLCEEQLCGLQHTSPWVSLTGSGISIKASGTQPVEKALKFFLRK